MPGGSSYLHLNILLFEAPNADERHRAGRFVGALDLPITPRTWTHDAVGDIRGVLTAETPMALANMPEGTLFVVPKPPHPNGYPLLFILKNGRLV